MQLPEQVRRFATLRSLGMTWGQGAALSLWEALLLAVPAVVLGLPLAGAVVWIALRAVVFAGPMPFTVVLPGRSMLAAALLWLGLYAAARLSVVWAAWRTPLVGQFQLPSGSPPQAVLGQAGADRLPAAGVWGHGDPHRDAGRAPLGTAGGGAPAAPLRS